MRSNDRALKEEEREEMRKAEFACFAKVNGKEVIIFKQHNVMKMTDGFHDRELSDEDYRNLRINVTSTRKDKLIRRLRGTRPWHPVLKAIDNASKQRLI